MSGLTGDRISADDVRRVKERADIVALALRWIPGAKKRGREAWACCPFHAEKTPSFSVSPKGFFHCFGCRAHGDVFKLYGWWQGLRDFPQLVRGLADELGVGLDGASAPSPSRPAGVRQEASRSAAGRGASAGTPPTPAVTRETERESERREAERKAKRVAGLLDDWKQARPLLEPDLPPSEAARYLAGRALDVELLAPCLGALRCHPALPYLHPAGGKLLTRAPAMMALIQAADRRVVGIHLTYLQRDGARVGKLRLHDAEGEVMPARRIVGQAQGGAVRLWPAPPRGARPVLEAGEGIETMLSVLQARLRHRDLRLLLEAGELGMVALLSLGNWAGREGPVTRRYRHPRAAELRALHGRMVYLPATEPDPEDPPAWLPRLGPGQTWAQVTWCADADNKDPESAECLVRRGVARTERAGVPVRVARPPAGLDFNAWLQRERAA